jgi:hypothetical protein
LDQYGGLAESSLRGYWYDPVALQWQNAALDKVAIDRVNHTIGFSTDRLGVFALAAEFDTDGDGLGDHEEPTLHETSYTDSDSDDDGILDGDEVWFTKSDPRDAHKRDNDDQYVILPELPGDSRTWVSAQITTDSEVSSIVQTMNNPQGEIGPSVWTHDVLRLQDGFPAMGILYGPPSEHSVRLDMATTVEPHGGWQAGGDSVVCEVVPIDADVLDSPQLHYLLHPNSIYDQERYSGWPSSGSVVGTPVVTAGGQTIPFRYCFDLPDEGFFFPGDVLHYFVEAVDDNANVMTSPADLSGFGDFSISSLYPEAFTVRALPTVSDLALLEHPTMLVWIDADDYLRANAWQHALANLGYVIGVDYDTYYTNGARWGLGNGLGGRATADMLAGYDTILYASGVCDSYTLGEGIPGAGDPGDDVGILTDWIYQEEERRLLFTGDNLVADLTSGGAASNVLRDDLMSVQFLDSQILPSPRNLTVQANGSLGGFTTYCGLMTVPPEHNTFDVIDPIPSAVGFLEFLDDMGSPLPHSAGVMHEFLDGGSNRKAVATLPYNLADVITPMAKGPMTTRAQLLGEILGYFGAYGPGTPTRVPETPGLPSELRVEVSPNPFNPRVTISYVMPRHGRLQVEVFDLRGRRVAVLRDEIVVAGPGEVTWTGRDATGQPVSSGVYFYRARAHGKVRKGKLTLMN